MAKQKAATAAELRDTLTSVVSIANAPGTTRTEMLDSFDQIIAEAEDAYPGVTEEAVAQDEEADDLEDDLEDDEES